MLVTGCWILDTGYWEKESLRFSVHKIGGNPISAHRCFITRIRLLPGGSGFQPRILQQHLVAGVYRGWKPLPQR